MLNAGLPGAIPAPASSAASATAQALRFERSLNEASVAVTAPEDVAAVAVDQFTRGASGQLHEALLAVDKADISLKFLVSVRNQVLESYREIMRMGG